MIGLLMIIFFAKMNTCSTLSRENLVIQQNIVVDSKELKKFWLECVNPIIKLDSNRLKNVVHFPLEGEWGNSIKLTKHFEEWTEQDFYNNLDKIFYLKFRDRLRKQNYEHINIFEMENGEPILLVSVDRDRIENGIRLEDSDHLFFKKIGGKWKLFGINSTL